MIKENTKKEEDKGKEKQFTIIVSGREKVVTEHKLTYTQVVQLFLNGAAVDPNLIYTVTYRKGNNDNHEGSMVDGDTVTIKDGMIFNVSATTKS